LKTIFTLVKKDFKLFFNDKVAFSLTFIVPVILIYIFGSIFGGGGSASGIRLAVLNKSNAPIAKKIEHTLDTSKSFAIIKTHKDDKNHELEFDSLSIKDYVAKGNAAGALVIPEDAYTDTSTGLRVQFYYDPKNEIESQMLQGLLRQAVMQSAPELFKESMLRKSRKYLGQDTGTKFNRELAGLFNRYFKVDTGAILHPGGTSKSPVRKADTAQASVDYMTNMLQLESQQVVGKDIKNPNVTRNVGGWALMFLLFSLTASASSLFEEEKSGVMLRILSAPVRGTHILWSKYIYNILLGIIQLSVMFGIGALIFKIDILSNFFNLFAVILAGAIACTSLGMLLAAYCKTEAQARGLGTFLILTMSAIGGAWFPTFLMPPFIQQVSKLTIVYWTVDGFMQVLWRNASFAEILPNLSFLVGFAAAVSSFSILKFRKNRF
jgi:ABC-2 type transport system permease protein